jgi:hypothetical protein
MAIQNQYSWGTGTPFTAEEIASWIPFKLDPNELILDNEDPYKATYHTRPISNDMPETWEFGSTPKDVYANSKISKVNQANSPGGRQLLIKHTAVKRRFDSADYTYYKLCPLGSHLVIQAPVNEVLTVADIQAEIRRMIGGLLQLVADTSVLERLMWGGVRMK